MFREHLQLDLHVSCHKIYIGFLLVERKQGMRKSKKGLSSAVNVAFPVLGWKSCGTIGDDLNSHQITIEVPESR